MLTDSKPVEGEGGKYVDAGGVVPFLDLDLRRPEFETGSGSR